MAKQFQVTVTNPDRAALFQRVFGSATVAVQFPFPVLADRPAGQGEQLAYLLDLREITDEQRARLVDHFAAELNLDRAFVEDRLTEQGVAIPATDAIMTTTANLGLWVDDAPEVEDYADYWAEVTDYPDEDNAPPVGEGWIPASRAEWEEQEYDDEEDG